MTEHPNAILIRRLYDAFVRGGYVETVREVFSEEVVWHLPGSGPLAGEHRGLEAVLAAIGKFETLSGGSIRLEVHDVLAGDEHAVALLRARGAREGKRYESREVDVFHLAQGKVTELWSFTEDQRTTDEFWS